jgi:hypothetical protein
MSTPSGYLLVLRRRSRNFRRIGSVGPAGQKSL